MYSFFWFLNLIYMGICIYKVINIPYDSKTMSVGDYNATCQLYRWLAFIPLIISIVILIVKHTAPSFFYMFFTMPLCVIQSLVSSNQMIKTAAKFDIPEDNEQLKKEKDNLTYGTISVIAGATIVGKGVKDAIKEIGNPDSWKEMK